MRFIAVKGGKQIPIEVLRQEQLYCLTIDGETYTVDAIRTNRHSLSLLIDGVSYEVGIEKRANKATVYFYNDTIEVNLFEARKFRATELTKKAVASGPHQVVAPMPGKIVKISVAEKSSVNEGDSLLTMEAMKMQNELKALQAGTVVRINVKEGDAVSVSQVLLLLE